MRYAAVPLDAAHKLGYPRRLRLRTERYTRSVHWCMTTNRSGLRFRRRNSVSRERGPVDFRRTGRDVVLQFCQSPFDDEAVQEARTGAGA